MRPEQAEGMLVGLAVGDALGAPVEFGYTAKNIRDEWDGQMQDHRIPKGYYTDDTAMALCLADSLLESGGYDSYDVMTKYENWALHGYRDSEGEPAPDIGNQTRYAITDFVTNPVVSKDRPRTSNAGNGSIMRLAPIVIAAYEEGSKVCRELAKFSARDTHFSEEAEAGTELFAALLYNAVDRNDKRSIVEATDFATSDAYVSVWSRVLDVTKKDFDPTTLEDLGGYVVDALKIAVWGFLTFDSFREGLVEVIKLGGDTDTNGAIYGQLAGAYYGYEQIPSEWLDDLYMLQDFITLADTLNKEKPSKIIATRFEEDEKYFKEYKNN